MIKKLCILLIVISSVVQKSQAQIIITAVGNHSTGYSGDGGQATAASLNFPTGLAFDHAGNLYIADGGNQNAPNSTGDNVVRMVNNLGVISLFAGVPCPNVGGNLCTHNGFSGDGGPATAAQLWTPSAVACDPFGNVYIADLVNNRIRIVNTAGIINTFAGNGQYGSDYGDGGPATSALIYQPTGLAADAAGNIYITDQSNANIRVVNTSGIISSIVGTWGNTAICSDAFGHVYAAYGDSIQNINPSGVVSTRFVTSLGLGAAIAFDAAGNLYTNNGNSITMINTMGVITPFAGGGSCGGAPCGDGGPATAAEFQNVGGDLACDAAGNLYIAACYNSVILEAGKCLAPTPNICMIQVDSLSQNNVIYWDNVYPTDTFYIYRDTANYNYALIGKVSADSLSMFTDTVRHLYAANGDPNASSWRYKIAYLDSCGYMSPMSPWHETVFMITNNAGIFSWNFYQIENESIPVSQVNSYYFEVDSFSNGHYHIVQTLSASSTSYHDTHYASYSNPTYRSTAVGFNCNSTALRLSGNNSVDATRVKSHSNTAARVGGQTTGIKQLLGSNAVSIYPNPNNGMFTIQLKEYENTSVEIYNTIGQRVFTQALQNNLTQLDLNSYANGMYQLRVIKNNSPVYQTKISKLD